jgi:hypothetical protein
LTALNRSPKPKKPSPAAAAKPMPTRLLSSSFVVDARSENCRGEKALSCTRSPRPSGSFVDTCSTTEPSPSCCQLDTLRAGVHDTILPTRVRYPL